MLTFYTAKGSSALAAHIMLEEVGADYEARFLSLPDREHLTPDYLAINPKGRVPALVTPEGTLTENVAILAWLAQTHPETGLAPATPFAFAKAQELNAFLAATMHVAFAHKLRGARWADDEAARAAMAAKVPENLAECARLLETILDMAPWALGETYSLCDPYLFLVQRWFDVAGADIAGFPALAAHGEAMRARPAVRRVLAAHDL